MKMTNGNGYRSFACQVSASKDLRFSSKVPCDLELDTISYAACRFLRKSRMLSQEYTVESYRLRLATGKGRKTKYRCFVAPAALMELPGAWVTVGVSISSTGVTVDRVNICGTLEEAQYAAQRYWDFS